MAAHSSWKNNHLLANRKNISLNRDNRVQSFFDHEYGAQHFDNRFPLFEAWPQVVDVWFPWYGAETFDSGCEGEIAMKTQVQNRRFD